MQHQFKIGDSVYYSEMRAKGEIVQLEWILPGLCLVNFDQYYNANNEPIDMEQWKKLSPNSEMGVYLKSLIPFNQSVLNK